jgi:hypothetical protein
MVTWLHGYWACGETKQYGRQRGAEQSCLPHSGWEAKRGWREVLGTNTLFIGMPPSAFFLQLDFISLRFQHLPIAIEL